MRILANQPRSKFLYIGILVLGALTLLAAIFLKRPSPTPATLDAVSVDVAPNTLTERPADTVFSERLWQQTLGSPVFERAGAIIFQTSRTLLIAGSQYDPANNFSDSIIYKTLDDGSLVTVKSHEGQGEDEITSLASMPDGTIYAAGHKGYAMSVLRLLDNGDTVWLKTFSEDGPNIANDLAITNTGELLVVGTTKAQGDGLLLRLDEDGTEIWRDKFLNGTAYSVAALENGGVVYGGASAGHAILIALDRTGQELWRLGTDRSDISLKANRIDAITLLEDRSILVAGVIIEGTQPINTIVTRVSPVGDILWQQSLGGRGDDQISAIIPAPGGAVLAGGTTSTPDGSMDMWVMRLDMNGTLLWQKTLGGSELDTAQDIIMAPDGSLILAGYTFSYGNGASDVWLVHMSIDGVLPHGVQSADGLASTSASIQPIERPAAETEPARAPETVPADEAIIEQPDLPIVAQSTILEPAETVEVELPPAEPAPAHQDTDVTDASSESEEPPGTDPSTQLPTVTYACTFHCQTDNEARVPFPVSQSLDLAANVSIDQANARASLDTELICLAAGGEPDPRYVAPTCSASP